MRLIIPIINPFVIAAVFEPVMLGMNDEMINQIPTIKIIHATVFVCLKSMALTAAKMIPVMRKLARFAPFEPAMFGISIETISQRATIKMSQPFQLIFPHLLSMAKATIIFSTICIQNEIMLGYMIVKRLKLILRSKVILSFILDGFRYMVKLYSITFIEIGYRTRKA